MKSLYEEIAHLYLRLNTFYTIHNLVLEGIKTREGNRTLNYEIDIIAYKPRRAQEKDREPDHELYEKLEEMTRGYTLEPTNSRIDQYYNIALICEVKGRKSKLWRRRGTDRNNHYIYRRILRYTLHALGITSEEADKAAINLAIKGLHIHNKQGDTIIALAGFSWDKSARNIEIEPRCHPPHHYIHIPLQKALAFAIERIKKHRDIKGRSITQYPSTIFNLLLKVDNETLNILQKP